MINGQQPIGKPICKTNWPRGGKLNKNLINYWICVWLAQILSDLWILFHKILTIPDDSADSKCQNSNCLSTHFCRKLLLNHCKLFDFFGQIVSEILSTLNTIICFSFISPNKWEFFWKDNEFLSIIVAKFSTVNSARKLKVRRVNLAAWKPCKFRVCNQ